MDSPNPTRREQELAQWAWGPGARADQHAERLACYREEILRHFEAMADDYAALQDRRVTTDLVRIIRTLRGDP